jgi:predicted permease
VLFTDVFPHYDAAVRALVRGLLRQRGYVALALSTLTFAVGANVVVFTVVNALWLKPRPVQDPDRVVWVTGDAGSLGSSENFYFAPLGLERLRETGAFESVAGQTSTSGSNAALRPLIVFEPIGHAIETIPVTPEYFSVLGLGIRGRDFTKDDDRAGSAPVAVISDRLWREAFDSRLDIINRTIKATPVDITVVGIAPPNFHGARLGERADLWIPRRLVPRVSSLRAVGGDGGGEFSGALLALARLRPHVTPANAERLIAEHDASLGRARMSRLVVIPLPQIFGSPEHRTIVVRERTVLQVVAGSAVFVLAGGCATLMALVLVHYERRRHELAVRLALGSSRRSLARRLALELGLLGAAGCGSALLLAYRTLAALPAFSLPGGIDLSRLDLTIDTRVIWVAAGASLLTLFGSAILPAERFTRASLAGDLIAPSSTSSAGSLKLRRAMLAVHVAATVMVLIGAGLFVRAVAFGFSRGAGFDVDRTVFVSVAVGSPYDLMALLGSGPRDSGTQKAAAAELQAIRRTRSARLLEQLAGTPGVEVLSLGGAPLGPEASRWFGQPRTLFVDGSPKSLSFATTWAGPDYLRALGISTLSGRSLTDADANSTGGSRSVVVTASLAAALWPDALPIGQRFQLGRTGLAHEVVGVVPDFAYGSMSLETFKVVLLATSLEESAGNDFAVTIRTSHPDQLASALHARIAAVLPDSSKVEVLTGREVVARDLGRERLGAWFFSGFGLVALLLGVSGVFGLVAYLAESRRREMGVRMALGATPQDLMRLAVWSGLAPVLIGAGTGLVGAIWLSRFVQRLILGIGGIDAPAYAGAALIMIVTAVGAGCAASRRIRRISPLEALRAE